MKSVLVTGGAGYIGSHTCKALARTGYVPVTYDNLSQGHRWAVGWGPLEVGDLADRGRLAQVIDQYRPVAAMHFAARLNVGESVCDPGGYYRNNVAGTLNLLEALRDAGVDQLVFSSTCATYGRPEWMPLTEDHPERPINPYGMSKLMVEHMLADFATAHGLRAMMLRYFNAAGADPEGEIGEAHDPEPHLIPLVLAVAGGQREAITVFGDDYDTLDGTCVRDYIHVADLAEAHVLALQALEGGGGSAAFNLGNGHGFSVQQVIETARKVTGREIAVIRGPRRAGDPDRLVGDASLARAELGWQPFYVDLEAIVATAWDWHRRHFMGS
ncbi:MAG: UDP-glucose 4-epimerase GalE [Candidatus Competibacterales bacterium]